MKKMVILNVLMSMLMISCGQNDELKPSIKSSKDLMNVTIHNKKDENNLRNLFLKEHVANIEYVGLEITGDNFISEVSKIYLKEDELIIFDYKSAQVFFFDKNGNYLNKLSKKGKAQDEYLSIATGLYDSINNQIIIYDNVQYKLLFYDLEGNCIKKLNAFDDNCVIRDLINLPDGSFLCYRGDNKTDEKYRSGLWKVDQNGKFVESYFEYDITLPLIFNYYNSSLQILPDNKILLIDAVHGDLSIYDNNTIEKVVNYDIKDNKLAQNIGSKRADSHNAKCHVSYGKGNYFISVWNDENGARFYVIHNRKERTTTFVDKFLNDDMDTPFVMGYIIDNNRNDVIALSMDIDYLKSAIVKNDLSDKQIQKMNELILKFDKKGSEATNYILEFVYLK